MVGGSSVGSIAGNFYAPAAANSETDGETFDGDNEYDEYEEWDYAEMLSNLYVLSRLNYPYMSKLTDA